MNAASEVCAAAAEVFLLAVIPGHAPDRSRAGFLRAVSQEDERNYDVRDVRGGFLDFAARRVKLVLKEVGARRLSLRDVRAAVNTLLFIF